MRVRVQQPPAQPRENPRLDRNGYWLLLKRLEQDRFIWPAADTVPTLTVEQLHWLLEGIDIGVVQRHPLRVYERVA